MSSTPKTPKKTRVVQIIEKQELFKKFIFRVEQVRFKHELFSGKMSEEVVRLNLDRGDSSAAIIYNEVDGTIILTEQFRYPAYEKGPGWLLELPAGVVEKKEEPIKTMRRELEEEIGFTVKSLAPIGVFYLSPGGTSERIHLFYANVTKKNQTGEGGGVKAEGENIRRVTVKVQDALQMVRTGEICDAKTIIGLQWLQINQKI